VERRGENSVLRFIDALPYIPNGGGENTFGGKGGRRGGELKITGEVGMEGSDKWQEKKQKGGGWRSGNFTNSP